MSINVPAFDHIDPAAFLHRKFAHRIEQIELVTPGRLYRLAQRRQGRTECSAPHCSLLIPTRFPMTLICHFSAEFRPIPFATVAASLPEAAIARTPGQSITSTKKRAGCFYGSHSDPALPINLTKRDLPVLSKRVLEAPDRQAAFS
jgi:hypothetical protein